MRSAFEERAAEQDMTLSHAIELGTNEAVKQGMMAQLGVAVLPPSSSSPLPSHGVDCLPMTAY